VPPKKSPKDKHLNNEGQKCKTDYPKGRGKVNEESKEGEYS
jgi:hypothetical protein